MGLQSLCACQLNKIELGSLLPTSTILLPLSSIANRVPDPQTSGFLLFHRGYGYMHTGDLVHLELDAVVDSENVFPW